MGSSSTSSLLLLDELCLSRRLSQHPGRRWRLGSSSLVYCLVNNLADKHLVVVFDCREREAYEKDHLHYSVCPWRNARDAQTALALFHAHGAPLVHAELSRTPPRKGRKKPPELHKLLSHPAPSRYRCLSVYLAMDVSISLYLSISVYLSISLSLSV